MIPKTLTAGLLAMTLAFTSIAPTQASARMSDEDALVGLLTLFAIGAAIAHSNNRDRSAAPAVCVHLV